MSKTVLVTGATGGIGRSLCERLALTGWKIILAARDADRLRSLARRLDHPERHSTISVDMADDLSVDAFADRLKASVQNLDGIVLMPPPLPRDATVFPESARWHAYFQQSFVGPLRLLSAAIDLMEPDVVAARRGKIVIVSAISSVQLVAQYAASNVLRPAWLGQAKTLAFALGGRGIHVNTVSLGGVLTEEYSQLIAGRGTKAGWTFEQQLAEETANVPLGKYGHPAEVAAVIEALLSEFSDHLTGVNIICDGGFTRSY